MLIRRLTGFGPPVVTTVNGITGALAEAIPAAYVDGKGFSFGVFKIPKAEVLESRIETFSCLCRHREYELYSGLGLLETRSLKVCGEKVLNLYLSIDCPLANESHSELIVRN